MAMELDALDVVGEPDEVPAGLAEESELVKVLQQSIRTTCSTELEPLNARIRELVGQRPELLYRSLTEHGQTFMILTCLQRGNSEAARFALELEKARTPEPVAPEEAEQ